MQAVETVHNLCTEFGNNDSKRIFLSAKTVWNTWRLLITDGHSHVWEKEFRLEDIDKQIQHLRLSDNDYETFFKKFKQCVESGNFSHISEREDLVVSFRGLTDINLKVTLHPCIEDTKTRLTQLMFELVQIINRKKTAFVDSVYTPSTGIPSASSPKKPISASYALHTSNLGTAKRKVGHSLLNPNSKRKPAKGAKIGEEV